MVDQWCVVLAYALPPPPISPAQPALNPTSSAFQPTPHRLPYTLLQLNSPSLKWIFVWNTLRKYSLFSEYYSVNFAALHHTYRIAFVPTALSCRHDTVKPHFKAPTVLSPRPDISPSICQRIYYSGYRPTRIWAQQHVLYKFVPFAFLLNSRISRFCRCFWNKFSVYCDAQ